MLLTRTRLGQPLPADRLGREQSFVVAAAPRPDDETGAKNEDAERYEPEEAHKNAILPAKPDPSQLSSKDRASAAVKRRHVVIHVGNFYAFTHLRARRSTLESW